MTKKIFIQAGSAKRNGVSESVRWTWPVYHKGKACYVDFSVWDPETGGMHRKRIQVQHVKGSAAREKYARALIRELVNKLSDGWNPWVDSSITEGYQSLDDALEKYSAYQRRMYSEGAIREETMRDYIGKLNVLRKWMGETTRRLYYVYQVDRPAVSAFMDWLLGERNLCMRTWNHYLTWLRGLFKWMIQRGYMKEDPSAGIDRMHFDKRAKNRTVIPTKELLRVRDYLEERNRHFLLACYMLHYVFVRPHEMTFIRIRDINIERKTLYLYGDQTKNHDDAVLTLPDKVLRLMVELRVFDAPGHYYLFSDGCRPGRVHKEAKMFRDYWNGHVRRDLKLASAYKFYSLKDTGITAMIRANMDVLSVRDQARHSSLAITNTYTPRDIKEANPLILRYKGDF